ncbi:MFS transporter [Nocardia beijingensis]|uniref:MFS transporter n=1 Tax=Nocardia beijingensis TaxID=95162 RepID=UPI000829DD83|nr:MFS transporter [Nocardia beijingensis]
MSTTPTVGDADLPAPEQDTGRLDGASRLRIFSVLVIIVLYVEVAPIQFTMISAALQKIAPSFPGAGPDITWALIVFGLIGASATPVIGKISDIWGKKRVLLICGALFALGCLVTATTSSWPVFLAGRCLQSTAAAMAVVSYGLIRDLLPHRYVPIGLGVAATGLGFSAALGPIVAGYLVDNHSWRAMFWVLFGYVVAMMPLVAAVVPESKLRVAGRVDIIGAALLSGGVAMLLLYVSKGHDWGWSEPATLAWLVAGIAALVAFVLVERRSSTPIMDMGLLFAPRVILVLVTAVFTSCLIGVHSYAIAYMAQTPSQPELEAQIAGRTVAQVSEMAGRSVSHDIVKVSLIPGYSYGDGLSLMEFALRIGVVQGLTAMIFGVVAGFVARRVGARLPLLAGLVLFIGSTIVLAVLPHTWQVFALSGIAFGAAFGLYYACMPILMVEAVPQEQQGISASMLGVTQNLGAAAGTAVITAFIAAHPIIASVSVAGRTPQANQLTNVFADRGYELGFWFGVAAAVCGLAVALVMKHGRTPATGGALLR